MSEMHPAWRSHGVRPAIEVAYDLERELTEARDEIALMRAELESQERVAEGLRARDGERTRAIFACQYAHELLTKALAKTGSDRKHYAEAAQAVVRSAGWPGGVTPGAPASE